MNNIVEKVKQYFSSNFGKLAGLIIGLSFIVTLILSILHKNRVDISILKGFISAIITTGILFLLGMVLKKYLGNIIDESVTSNSDIDYTAIDANAVSGYENVNDNVSIDETSNNNDININDDIIPNITDNNIDKNQKVDYHNSVDDIGSIVFGGSNAVNTAQSNYSSSTSSMFPDKKLKNADMIKEVHEDPEKVAKAVRTMIAKDEKENK